MLRAGCGPFSKLHPSDDFDLDGSKRTVCCDELTLLSSCSIHCEIFFCPQRSAHHCDDDDDDDGDDDDDDDNDNVVVMVMNMGMVMITVMTNTK